MFRWNHTRSINRTLALALLASSVLASPALAQDCVRRVSTSFGQAGLSSSVGHYVNDVVAWDPDGPGPRGQVVLAAGTFARTATNGALARGVVTWDPASRRWEAFPGVGAISANYVVRPIDNGALLVGGRSFILRKERGGVMTPDVTGLSGTIYEIFQLPDGRVLAGGNIAGVGGQAAGNMIVRDENGWKPFESQFDGDVYSLDLLSDGSLLVGGWFTSIDGAPFLGIARQNGNVWEPLGGGLTLEGDRAYVSDAIELPDGSIVVGGRFDHAGTTSVDNIARWDGHSWSGFGELEGGGVTGLALGPQGEIYATGPIARDPVSNERVFAPIVWDGAAWSPLGRQSLASDLWGIARLDDGSIYVAMDTDSGFGGIARWDGERWYGLDGGIDGTNTSTVFAVEPDRSGGFYAAGDFDFAGGVDANNIAFFNGQGWIELGEGLSYPAHDMALADNGDLYVVGLFGGAGGIAAKGIARWDGAQWHPLGEGLTGLGYAVVTTQGGDVYAAGQFASAGGQPANNIARWDGTEWNPLGEGLSGPSYALLETHDGDIIAGGSFLNAGDQNANSIALWDGERWSPLGQGIRRTIGTGIVRALAQLPDGDIVAAGEFDLADDRPALNVARWDGTQWNAMGAGLTGRIYGLEIRSNGDMIAFGGVIDGKSVIARWNGVEWEALTQEIYASRTYAIAELADGDIVVGGEFSEVVDFDGLTTIPSYNIARYTIPDCCLADWDSSGGAPDPNDFLAYLNDWSAHAPAADLAPAGGDGNWDSSDLLAYLNLYANGC